MSSHAESKGDGTQHWLAALDTIEALRPTAVVSGHKRDGDPDSPADIERTRHYIHDFAAAAEKADSHTEPYEMMIDLYPHRLNRGVLWNSARAAMT